MEKARLAGRESEEQKTVVEVGGQFFGGREFQVIAGPCAVETAQQMCTIATGVRASGARLLRAGAYKPRTSPYDFQGLAEEGLAILAAAGQGAGLPVVTEVVAPGQVALVSHYADMLQIGTRNMTNFELLKAVGGSDRPCLLKRGMSATLEEFVMAAEYIMAHGNPQVILCERGIRTFETYTRNTLDLSAVPALRELTHLPVIVDPSHATGRRSLVGPMVLASAACGADGVIVEVHHDPEHSWTGDGKQSLDLTSFATLMGALQPILEALGRGLTVDGRQPRVVGGALQLRDSAAMQAQMAAASRPASG